LGRSILLYMRRHHLALLALFVALGGTSVAASNRLLPRNSVGTRQVINGSLLKADLSKKTVATLRGKRGLRGAPGATGLSGPKGDTGSQGPVGPTFARAGAGDCDPSDATLVVCASTGAITLPAAGRVLLIGTSGWIDNNSPSPNQGACVLAADGANVTPSRFFGEATNTHTGTLPGSFSTTGITAVLSSGLHTFALECNEFTPDVAMQDSTITAVLLGGG
jgi:hypothetical protein